MKSLRLIAIDDEPLALRRLELLIEALPHTQLVATTRSLDEGRRLIDEHQPDAVLLDIELGDRSGFDLFDESASTDLPAVIFVTAFSHHAAAAFERDVVDYLLKPVQVSRLAQALERIRNQLATKDVEQRVAELRALVERLRTSQTASTAGYETEFWIRRTGGELVRVDAASIDVASAEEDYVRLFADGRSHLLRESLNGLERRLQPGVFVRVHRAHLVRRSAIRELRRGKDGGLEVVLKTGSVVPAGRVHARSLRQALNLRRSES
ncbi:DNA-binding LytR/AlgR family response regulator [Povalibacter uvarum]|uniref:DNA-binding LytR/AlgR family response regulator n=1 Tax=Povalibacter uvarum TaxID=732238 RepID=A0A841HTL7_9GAMM|nr:LytTR family DNA-binding domain-containing protein [Povalibacter uvarum]MBB6096133.1 DNA-binding LytR/AlgR family response regulator [Povalibacter uvarum]